MKRLIVAAASVGALSLALVAGPASAGATTGSKAIAPRSVRPHSTAVVTVSPDSNLKNGQVVAVQGSGFPGTATLDLTECNADGGGPGPTAGQCDLKALKLPKTGPTGAFHTTFKIVDGTMTAGKTGVSCPQNFVQAQHAVACIIGAEDLTTNQFAFAAITFVAPPLKFSYSKSTIIGGKQTYKVTIKESGDYAGVKPAPDNAGGFFVIGAYGTAKPPSRDCQGTTSTKGKTWNPPGLPACTDFYGEVVQINWAGKKLGLVRVGAKTPGSFTVTIAHADAGKYAVEALGLTSGEKLTATAVVP
ncbi:MAG: neocarzinostatin apoprotein domain-containing protein [Acidimicrobiales bacterium]|jgi:hypothetical protein